MANSLGVWIDHKKAFLVEINGKEILKTALSSEVEPHTRYHSGVRAAGGTGSPEASAETKADNRRANQLKNWYKEVLDEVKARNAAEILILGPGEAKTELMGQLEKTNGLSAKVVGVETTDQLTENQIAAAVRDYFNPKADGGVPSYRKPPGA